MMLRLNEVFQHLISGAGDSTSTQEIASVQARKT
jgi:hypothetical protein